MTPAWRFTFAIRRLVSSDEPVQTAGFINEARSENMVMRGTGTSETGVVAELTVTSLEPYKVDALDDALRKARDACNVLAARLWDGNMLDPVAAPIREERLEGAKDPPRPDFDVRLTAHTARHLDELGDFLADAEKVELDPEVRANLDTWRLATLEPDQATKLIHHHRIVDGAADDHMEAEPPLLDEEQISACVSATMDALPEGLNAKDRERVQQTVQRALGRVARRSRPDVLAAWFTRLLGRPVEPAEVRSVDKARGKYAHNPSELGVAPDENAERLLRQAARALVRSSMRR